MLLEEFMLLSTKNYAHMRVASLIGGKARIAAWETVPQIALRDHSEEAGGKDRIYVILAKGEVHAIKHIFFCRNFLLLSKCVLVTRSSSHPEGS